MRMSQDFLSRYYNSLDKSAETERGELWQALSEKARKAAGGTF